ncbi:hypothetical protein BX070DRAFT_265481 [Coemansia spiralis]|nr:hypothetical protein BX070DRAFT_265481 [Coemansia spiralis]
MAKRKEPTDGSNTNRNNGGYDELICTECGSSNIISSAGDQYCGDCGAVLESIILTTHHSYEAEHAASGTKYQRISQHVDTSDPGSVRLHNRWNQEMIRQSKSAIVGLCRQLGIQNIAERAERMFVDSSRGFMSAGEEWVFGRRTSVRIAACVYISALQDGKALTLVDIARTAQVSVYVIGHEAKRTLAILHIKLPLLDPLLRVEQAVNRIFGCALKTRDDTEERRLVVEQISGKTKKAQGFPVQLVDFIEANEELRPRLIELSGQIMTFDRICSLSTGVNPNTLVCSAVSMGLEHFYYPRKPALTTATATATKDEYTS